MSGFVLLPLSLMRDMSRLAIGPACQIYSKIPLQFESRFAQSRLRIGCTTQVHYVDSR